MNRGTGHRLRISSALFTALFWGALTMAIGAGVPAEAAGKINVNTASAAELARVPGIDAQTAVRIVARRTSAGPYRSLDELLQVPGVTKMSLVSAIDHLEAGPPGPPPTPIGGGKKLDLNQASFAQLLLLPEMTPRAAKAIVDHREKNGPFRSIEELGRVPGLDKRLVVGLLDRVAVSGSRPAPSGRSAPGQGEIVLGDEGWSGSWTGKLERAATPVPAPTNTPLPMRPGEKIDVNTADRETLQRLPDIGPVMSQRIVDFREKNGPFRTEDDLIKVRGIGTQRMTALRPWVVVTGAARRPAAPAPAPRKSTPVASRASAPAPASVPAPVAVAVTADGRVNINVAGVQELMTLPRMTPSAAAEIVAHRQKNGPFRDPHEIVQVPSIGEATYAKIRAKITVGN